MTIPMIKVIMMAVIDNFSDYDDGDYQLYIILGESIILQNYLEDGDYSDEYPDLSERLESFKSIQLQLSFFQIYFFSCFFKTANQSW